ncbi:hypothetical protein DPMN_061902 [Dreissena polymorpha]|uniref:B box-type domain-containing protein n=1 Tax=Dreissena polymorpha TaxID=45954 RepID=A0A9D4HIV4_DREPO|nr:hypothetical protein DPMN_061902 [Dreissena polymorpha]
MCDQLEIPSGKLCDPCSVEGKKEESTNFCVNCLEYFCINCAKDHRKYKQSRDHIILEELPPDTTIYEALSTLSRCGIHPEIEIEKFCKLHDAVICRYCVKDMHNGCDDIVDIEDCEKGEIEAIPHTLVELKNKYVEQKTILDIHLEDLDYANSEVTDNIMAYVQNVRDVADSIECSLIETLDSIVSPLHYSLKQEIEHLEITMKKVSEFETFHQLIKSHNYKKEKYILVCKLSELLKASVKVQAIVSSVSSQKIRFMTPANTNELITELSKCRIDFASSKQLSLENCSDEDTSYVSCYDEAKTADLKTVTIDTMKQLQCTEIELKNDKATQVDKHVFDSKLDEGVQIPETALIKRDQATQVDTYVFDSKLDKHVQVPETALIKKVKATQVNTYASVVKLDKQVQVPENNFLNFDNNEVLHMGFMNHERIFTTRREDDVIVDGPSNIVALDVLTDGRIILIDSCQHVIKLFSNDLTFISWMMLENEPTDMCVIEDKKEKIFTVAVCYDECRYLSIIDYAGDFETKSTIECNGTALSVTVFAPDILVLSYTNNTRCKDYAIEVINPTDGLIRFAFNVPRKMVINSGFKIHMHDLFIIRACSIANRIILAANEELYVFEISKCNSIQERLEIMMQCDWFYKRSGSTNLTNVFNVKTDVEGNIYVCDRKSGLHQISSKSCRDSCILLADKKNISAIAIDMTKRRFFVMYENTPFGNIFYLW